MAPGGPWHQNPRSKCSKRWLGDPFEPMFDFLLVFVPKQCASLVNRDNFCVAQRQQCPCVAITQCPCVAITQCPCVAITQCPCVAITQCPCVAITQCPCVAITQSCAGGGGGRDRLRILVGHVEAAAKYSGAVCTGLILSMVDCGFMVNINHAAPPSTMGPWLI